MTEDMKTKHFVLLAILSAVLISCADTEPPVTDSERLTEFTKGADISWVTQMEKDGVRFYSSSGEEIECTALMKEIGFDAIRLRVWANPTGKWCDKADVLAKAKRAQKLGMDIMIDFHYSSTWADPGNQTPPAAWASYSESEMADAVEAHTKDILQAMKDNSIDIRWVQIGNEVNQGMLWPLGKVNGQSVGSFVTFLNAGYDAAKSIFPDTQVILHVSNGHDSDLFFWFFGLMDQKNASYDIIGMSLYPSWWENGGWCSWRTNVDKCMDNIQLVSRQFGKPVMICETGMPVNEPQMSADAMQYILDEAYKLNECLGVFYWEPQTDGVWKPAEYEGLGWNAYDKGAFKNGRPTKALDAFGN